MTEKKPVRKKAKKKVVPPEPPPKPKGIYVSERALVMLVAGGLLALLMVWKSLFG